MKPTKITLFKHQQASVKFLGSTPCAFDMSDAGTGKTGVHITAFAKHKQKYPGHKMLVLCPRSLMHSAWEKDVAKFAPHLTVSVAYASNRKHALAKDADVYVCNHDAAKVLADLPAAYWKSFSHLVVDESTAFKHHTTARSKAVGKVAKHFTHRRLLSATPTSNGVCDIWHQAYIVDEGRRLGKSFFAFRSAVCTPRQQYGAGQVFTKWEDKDNAEAIVAELLKDITIRHKFEECVDIPENHQYSVEFSLSPSHMRQYRQLEAESVLELTHNEAITAINAAVLYNKLLQLASGAVYSSTDKYSVVDTDRYELVMDLAEARDHSIVFFNWSHQRDQLVEIAKSRGMSYGVYDGSTSDSARSKLVDQYQAGVLRVLFAHPASAGHGLTLTRGTATIWASPTINLEHYLQGLKRIHRIGQRQRTENIVVVAEDTLEPEVFRRLMEKDAKMTNLLTTVQIKRAA